MSRLNYEVKWADSEQTIMLATFDGRLVADEYRDFFERINQIISEVEHRVDVIVDLSNVSSYDVRGLIGIAPRMNAVTARNYGLSVVIGMSTAARVVADAAFHLAPRLVSTIRCASTLEEAYSIIADERAAATQPDRQVLAKSQRV